jgi:hypothetical protein
MAMDTPERPFWLVPASQRRPSEEAVREIRRPITPEEHQDLVRRLNAPGGGRIVLSSREDSYLDTLPPVRDAAEAARLRAALATETPGAYVDGISDALAYAYGQAPAGPVSGEPPRVHPPLCGDLGNEEAIAYRVLRRQLVHTDHPVRTDTEYVTGVEHTLMWLQCRTDDWPL